MNAGIPVINEDLNFLRGFFFLYRINISDSEIKKYNINVQNVDVSIK